MSTGSFTKPKEVWNGHGYESVDGAEVDDHTFRGLLRKAFDAGFEAACEYWENPAQYLDVDINDHQDREREKVIKLLG